MTGMGSHHSSRRGSNVWLTPQHVIEALGSFDLDPCAAEEPRPWPTASRHIAPPADGLTAEWSGRVFMNPPYQDVERWVCKLADHGCGTALVFARTDTGWFTRQVWERATAVLFLRGRLHFRLPDGSRAAGNAGAPSCLVAYGRLDADLMAVSELAGEFVRLSPLSVPSECGDQFVLDGVEVEA